MLMLTKSRCPSRPSFCQRLAIRAAGVKRNATPPGLTAAALQTAFTQTKGGAASSPTADGKSRIIFTVPEIKAPPEPTAEQLATLKSELANQLRIEAVLLQGTQRSWAAQVLSDAGAPLRDLDPAELPGTYAVDPKKVLGRDGQWSDL